MTVQDMLVLVTIIIDGLTIHHIQNSVYNLRTYLESILDHRLSSPVSVQLSSLFYQYLTAKLFTLGKCIKTDRTELKNVCCFYAIISTSIVNINTP